jgi:hypothetical protein
MFDWVEDAVDVVTEPFVEVYEAVETATEWVDDAWTAAESIVEDTGSFFEDFGGGVLDTAGWFVEEVAAPIYEEVAPIVDDVFTAVGENVLGPLDDVGFFDVVDTATLGLIDAEYDSETGFGLEVGIEDVWGFGVQVGEGGISGDIDAGIAGVEGGWTDEGFEVGASVGIDYGPLPSADIGISVDEEGQFGIEGRAEAYLPTPAGFVGGEVAGAYQETPEGFQVSGELTGRYFAPSGTYAGAGVHASYEEDAEGYSTEVGVHGEVGQLGVGEVRGEINYTEGREGDVTYQGVGAEVEAEGYGLEAGAAVDYTHLETPEGEFDVVSGEGYVEGYGVSAEGEAAVTSGPDGVSFTADGDIETDLSAGEMLDVAGDALGVEIPGGGEAGGFELPEGVEEAVAMGADAMGVEMPEGVEDVVGMGADALGVELPEIPEGIEGLGAVEEALADTATADEVGGVLEDALGSALDELSAPAPVEEMVEVAVEETVEYVDAAPEPEPVVESPPEEATFVE